MSTSASRSEACFADHTSPPLETKGRKMGTRVAAIIIGSSIAGVLVSQYEFLGGDINSFVTVTAILSVVGINIMANNTSIEDRFFPALFLAAGLGIIHGFNVDASFDNIIWLGVGHALTTFGVLSTIIVTSETPQKEISINISAAFAASFFVSVLIITTNPILNGISVAAIALGSIIAVAPEINKKA